MKIAVLGSGSKGNAVWVGTETTSVLFDAGLSCLQIHRRLDEVGVDPESLKAVFVSHEHRDHISGLRVFLKRKPLPVVATGGTAAAMDSFEIPISRLELFNGNPVIIGDLQVEPIPVAHDAAEPVGFLCRNRGISVGIITDLGCATNLVRQRMKGCHALILEFNHDRQMLLQGPYHPDLKSRIISRHGHLSNQEAAELAADLYHSDFQTLILAHISQINNLPQLAVKEARQVLPQETRVLAATQNHPIGILTIG